MNKCHVVGSRTAKNLILPKSRRETPSMSHWWIWLFDVRIQCRRLTLWDWFAGTCGLDGPAKCSAELQSNRERWNDDVKSNVSIAIQVNWWKSSKSVVPSDEDVLPPESWLTAVPRELPRANDEFVWNNAARESRKDVSHIVSSNTGWSWEALNYRTPNGDWFMNIGISWVRTNVWLWRISLNQQFYGLMWPVANECDETFASAHVRSHVNPLPQFPLGGYPAKLWSWCETARLKWFVPSCWKTMYRVRFFARFRSFAVWSWIRWDAAFL